MDEPETKVAVNKATVHACLISLDGVSGRIVEDVVMMLMLVMPPPSMICPLPILGNANVILAISQLFAPLAT